MIFLGIITGIAAVMIWNLRSFGAEVAQSQRNRSIERMH